LNFNVNYTRATNTAFCGGDVVNTCVPQDSIDFRADYGPTDFEIRDAFKASFVYQLPLPHMAALQGRAGKSLVGGWQFSGILTANDGTPVNITNKSSSYPSDRPNPIPGIPAILGNYQSTRLYLNAAAFASVPIVKASGAQQQDGTLGRDVYFGPGGWNLDSSLAKSFDITERVHFQLRGDFFNTFNHTNLSGLVTNISTGSFGQLTSATARSVQIGGKLFF
jgi:hypothetical protein